MRLTPNNLKKLVEAWEAAGLDPEPAQIFADARARHRDIGQQYSAYKTRTLDRAELVGRIAAGELTIDQAVVESLADQQRELAFKLYSAAQVQALAAATRMIEEAGPSITADVVVPREAEIFKAATTAAKTVGEVATTDEAFEAGGEVTAAWHELAELRRQWVALGKVVGALNSVRSRGDVGVELEHPHPELVPKYGRATMSAAEARAEGHKGAVISGGSRFGIGVDPVRRFADLVLSGAGPRVLVEAAPKKPTARPRRHNEDASGRLIGAASGSEA